MNLLSGCFAFLQATETASSLPSEIKWEDTTPYIPNVEKGKVIKVYDGDTITVASKLPHDDTLYRFSVRLNGIDCPEIKSNDEGEIQCAQLAKKMVSDLILNKNVELKNIKLEKYGRLLADVYYDGIDITHILLDNHLAVVYNGKSKNSPSDWLLYYQQRETLGTLQTPSLL